jgi:hypothetical protein
MSTPSICPGRQHRADAAIRKERAGFITSEYLWRLRSYKEIKVGSLGEGGAGLGLNGTKAPSTASGGDHFAIVPEFESLSRIIAFM